jgi:hypothetical protein
MHRQQLLLAMLFLVLPIEAQSNQALPPNVPEVAGDLIPPHDNNSILVQPQATAPAGRAFYRWSVAAVLAGSVADTASGWKSEEANPVLAGTGKQFGAESVAIKSGLVGVSLLIQYIALRHRPDLYKRMAWLNLVTAGALGGVAGHNVSVR